MAAARRQDYKDLLDVMQLDDSSSEARLRAMKISIFYSWKQLFQNPDCWALV
ncbi:hypothetical protein P5673_033772 [Acropora cervicornis]|uniref:Uncharacterized protein n=1 Tax=Acropora cervicornis TaxID=6130 RepID=A0AAD9PP82_ACRCE|nr:hypothetical protein P5673_033772 [Acropora cervicornis]